MSARILSLVFLLAMPLAIQAAGTATTHKHRANPIRKVVTLLQEMEQKVTAEGKKEEELHEKFLCYCKAGEGEFGGAVDAANKKIPELQSAIEEGASSGKQLAEDLIAHKSDREAAKTAMAEATSMREKENKAFLTESGDLKTNAAALGKAITAIDKGASASFLQTSTAAIVKNIAFASTDMSDVDRQDLLSFLSGEQSDGEYAATGSEVLGIMKQLADEMAADLSAMEKAEAEAIAQYDGLMAAKAKSIEALTSMIEDKTGRVGETAVAKAQDENDLEDTQESLAEDTKLLADLQKECAAKTAEYEEACKVRNTEILAIQDTIKFLNSDEALELFKKVLPGAGASFIQLQVSAKAMKARALAMLREGRKHSKHPVKLDFIALALRGKGGFDKVVEMIDTMMAQLKVDQQDDADKKEYCEKELDKTEDEKKELTNQAMDIDTALEDTQESIDGVKADIEAISDGIRALDHSVEDATEQRKDENEAFKAMMAGNTAAKDLLEKAKERLNKGTSLPAITAMMDELVAGLDKEMTIGKAEEKDGQADYEELMKDSSAKRAEDSKTMTDKEGALAELETELEAHKGDKMSTLNNLMKTGEMIMGLHKECDWLLENFEARKSARTSESEAMDKAKAVLSGADYSLLQMGGHHTTVTRKFLRHA